MAQISIEDLSIGFRGPALLDQVSCRIDAGQKIGLLGRNGAGKTTFMKMLCGKVEPDHGSIHKESDLKISLLTQDVPKELSGSIFEITRMGLGAAEREEEWKAEQAIKQTLSRMGLDGDASFATLSSGMKRRVLLARALVNSPDVLLLDEPTNHLDIPSIRWLEDFLDRWRGTLIFVTHDRMFLRRLATRILEIERGKIFDWSCDYDTFLERKEAAIAAQEKQDALFDKKLAEEEVWIRTGIRARRTRNEGRVRVLQKMRQQRADRRAEVGKVHLQIQEAQRSGNLVADVKNVGFGYDDTPIFKDFSTLIMRGDKVGVMGPNGAGKSTLLRVLLGTLQPQQGSVRLGTNLQVSYFDQLREQLNDQATVQDNVGDGYDTIRFGNQTKNVIGYLQDFLFSPERARTPVRFLSGGERNRVLLAKLFSKPANMLVLDEPTNDLDTETLELLESKLVEFQGTVLLVSHDRQFLNNVVTSTIVFEKSGLKEYVGGYDDWLRQASPANSESNSAKSKATTKTSPKRETQPAVRKLKYKEQQELAALPGKIEELEAEIASIHDAMASSDFYQQPGNKIAATQAKLDNLQTTLQVAYERWEELAALE